MTEALAEFERAGMPVDREGFRVIVRTARRTGHLTPVGWQRTGKPGHPEPAYPIGDLQRLHRDIASWISVNS